MYAFKLCYRSVRVKPVFRKTDPVYHNGINKRTLTLVEGKKPSSRSRTSASRLSRAKLFEPKQGKTNPHPHLKEKTKFYVVATLPRYGGPHGPGLAGPCGLGADLPPGRAPHTPPRRFQARLWAPWALRAASRLAGHRGACAGRPGDARAPCTRAPRAPGKGATRAWARRQATGRTPRPVRRAAKGRLCAGPGGPQGTCERATPRTGLPAG